jgi:hypothetical protein
LALAFFHFIDTTKVGNHAMARLAVWRLKH